VLNLELDIISYRAGQVYAHGFRRECGLLETRDDSMLL